MMILNKRKQEMLRQGPNHSRHESKGIKINLNLDLSKVEHRHSAFSPGSHLRH